MSAELPDPFLRPDGARVRAASEWEAQRRGLAAEMIRVVYGGLPPEPRAVRAVVLHRHREPRFGGAFNLSLRVECEPCFWFGVEVQLPPGDGPFPVVVTGDACWRYLTDEVLGELLGRGIAVAEFNRLHLASDHPETARQGGLYAVYPEGRFGALAAWAWGCSRCLDALRQLPEIDPAKIAVAGHSRGGKTALLAGATDPRFAMVWANQSGFAGAGCFRWATRRCEGIADALGMFPYWYGEELAGWAGREAAMPFDLHYLKALVAPRPLLTTEALGDDWANPEGTWQTHRAAAEVYRFLGGESNLQVRFRPGPHDHRIDDWRVFAGFAEAIWRGGAGPDAAGDAFPDLAPLHRWAAPGG